MIRGPYAGEDTRRAVVSESETEAAARVTRARARGAIAQLALGCGANWGSAEHKHRGKGLVCLFKLDLELNEAHCKELDEGECHSDGVVGVAFAPDGGRLASASTDG